MEKSASWGLQTCSLLREWGTDGAHPGRSKKLPSSRAFPPLNPPYNPWGAKQGEDGAGSRAEPPSSSIPPPQRRYPSSPTWGSQGCEMAGDGRSTRAPSTLQTPAPAGGISNAFTTTHKERSQPFSSSLAINPRNPPPPSWAQRGAAGAAGGASPLQGALRALSCCKDLQLWVS